MTRPARDGTEVEALRTDRYLDSLLIAADRRAADAPADAAVDQAIRRAAVRLRRDLVRVHPSFRFEERLAARLAEAARATRLPAAAGGETGPSANPPALFDRLGGPGAASDVDPAEDHDDQPINRPLLIGGALTSAALSLAGAAFVAWRRSRPDRSPMARAVRVARAASRVAGRAARTTPERLA